MKHRLFKVLSVVSLLLCLGSGSLWVLSYWAGHFLEHTAVQVTSDGSIYRTYGFADGRGWLSMRFERWSEASDSPISCSPGWAFHRNPWALPPYQYLDASVLGIVHDEFAAPGDVRVVYGVVLPYWPLTLLSAITPTLWFVRWRTKRHRDRLGLCLKCGYDLRASQDRCPECGTAICSSPPSGATPREPLQPYEPVSRPRPWYRKGRYRIGGAVVVAIAALTIGWHVYFSAQIQPNLANIFAPHAIAAVTESQWQKVSNGMTKAQVRAVLGSSESERSTGSLETWEYNWTDGLALFYPSPKAYVVCFGADGKVFSLRRPIAMMWATTEPAAQDPVPRR